MDRSVVSMERAVGVSGVERARRPRVASVSAKSHKRRPLLVEQPGRALYYRLSVETEVSYASSGAVLVVDDEPEVRRLVSAILTGAGYAAFLADSGEQAVRVFHKHANEITLLLADVIAPGMSGPMLADQLLEMQPHVKVLFMSGYNATQVVRRFVVERGFTLLAKPFTPAQLLEAVGQSIGPARRAMHGR